MKKKKEGKLKGDQLIYEHIIYGSSIALLIVDVHKVRGGKTEGVCSFKTQYRLCDESCH